MLIYTEAGWKQFGAPKADEKRVTTKAAERMYREVVATLAAWARDHNAMVNAPGRRTVMHLSALTHHIK
jgi:hypothetical protein